MNVSEPPRASKDLRALAELPPAFAKFLGIEITEITLDRVVARLAIRAELGNRNDVAAGGVLMALADHLGGSAAFANLPPGARTTTIESKTNFFAAIPLGDTALTAPAVVTVNVVGGPCTGDLTARLPAALAVPGVRLHLYGKQSRPGRKIGHVTALGRDLAALRRDTTAAAAYLATGVPGEVGHG